jgi:hypothetical protein
MVRVLFRNVNNNQNRYFQNFYGFTNTTAMDENLPAENVAVFPNPVSDALMLEGFDRFHHYSVSYQSGKILITGIPAGCLSLKQLAAGIYFLRLTGNAETLEKKIVKSH